MTLRTNDLPQFIQQLQQDAREHFDIMPVEQLQIDAVLTAQQLTLDTVYGMQALEPFGCGNELPVVALLVQVDASHR